MKLSLLFSLVILPLSLFAASGLPDKPYIYVEGKAEVKKQADTVILRFELVGRAADQPKANDDVQSKASKILALLKERKIADDDVIAQDLRSEPEYEQDENYSRGHTKLIGYKVTRPFEIKIRDVNAFPKLADEIIRVQGAEFSGVEGQLAKEKEIQDQLWDKALADAQAKAEKTLKTIGMKIDSVFAVAPISPPEIETKIFGEITRLGVRGAEVAGRTEAAAPEYRIAPVEITQSVYVIYLISPAK